MQHQHTSVQTEAEPATHVEQATDSDSLQLRDHADLSKRDYLSDITQTATKLERQESEHNSIQTLVFEQTRESLWTTIPEASVLILEFGPDNSTDWHSLITEHTDTETDWIHSIRGMAQTIYRRDLQAELRSRE